MSQAPAARYVCRGCFQTFEGYVSQCACGRWNSLIEAGSKDASKLPVRAREGAGLATALRQVPLQAVNRALGGLAPGGVYLLGGERGSGKSTLAMQIAAAITPSIYVTAEEPREQVCARGVRIGCPEVAVTRATEIEEVFRYAEGVRGGLCVIDSLPKIARGRMEEQKEASERLTNFAHERGVTLILVAHMTKDDMIAGPRKVEHDADTVCTLRPFGGGARVLRASKNRFGPDGVGGWLKMTPGGLVDAGPAVAFPTEALSGRVLTVDREGMPREVQARYLPDGGGMCLGVSQERVRLVCSVLECSGHKNWLVRADGDAVERDEGADLAIAVAIMSEVRGRPVSERACGWGQLSLDGRVLPSEDDVERADSARDMGLEAASGKTVWEILQKLGLGSGLPPRPSEEG